MLTLLADCGRNRVVKVFCSEGEGGSENFSRLLQETGDNCTVMSLKICNHRRNWYQTKEYEMGEAISTHGRDEQFTQRHFVGNPKRERSFLTQKLKILPLN